MLLRDIGLDVDDVYRVLSTEREEGVQQYTFIFECDYEYEAVVKQEELFTSICEHSERRFAYTEVRVGNPDVEVKPRLFFECVGDIWLQKQENGKWLVGMVGIQKPYRPDYKMESVGWIIN